MRLGEVRAALVKEEHSGPGRAHDRHRRQGNWPGSRDGRAKGIQAGDPETGVPEGGPHSACISVTSGGC